MPPPIPACSDVPGDQNHRNFHPCSLQNPLQGVHYSIIQLWCWPKPEALYPQHILSSSTSCLEKPCLRGAPISTLYIENGILSPFPPLHPSWCIVHWAQLWFNTIIHTNSIGCNRSTMNCHFHYAKMIWLWTWQFTAISCECCLSGEMAYRSDLLVWKVIWEQMKSESEVYLKFLRQSEASSLLNYS